MAGLVMKYFVLNPAGNHAYAEASREAMQAYADVIQHTNPALAEDLREWAEREVKAAYNHIEDLDL